MIKRYSIRHAAVSALLATMLLASCGGDKPETLLASGKEFIAKSDHKAAIIQIKNALQINSNLPEGRFLLGKALLGSGNPSAAEMELRKARDLKYPFDQVAPLLARAMLEQGQFKKVTEEFAESNVTATESKADLLTTLGMAYASQRNKQAAQTAFAAAVTAQPDFAPALIAQAQMRASDNDLPGALALIDSALAKAPSSHEAWKLKGDLLLFKGETEPALAAFRKGIEIKPDFLAAHTAVITALMRQANPDEAAKQFESMKKAAPKHPQTLYMETLLTYQKKDFAKARELIQQLLKIAPNNLNALQMAGEIDYQLKSYVQAEANLTKVVQLAPEHRLARRFLSMTYLRMHQPAKALSVLEPVLGKIEADTNMLTLAGEVYLQNGEVQKAEEYFSKALALDPKNPSKRTALALTHLSKGNETSGFTELEQIAATDTGTTADLALISSLLQRKDFDKALAAISNLEKKQPDNPLLHYMRGRTLIAKKDIAGARKSFERALSLSAVYFPAAASLANLDLIDKQPDSAKKRFEAVLAADPKHVQALLALAELRAKTGGTPADVATLINKAISANPTEATPRLALVSLYLGSKDAKKAVAAAQDAVAIMPDNPEILDMLGRAQQAAGDSNQALAVYNKLAGLQPNSPLPHLRMAEIHLATKNKDAALQSLRKSLDIKPDLIEAQRGLMMLYLDAGKMQDAISIAREVQKQRPKEAIGFILEGDANAAKKSWKEAATTYRTGLKQVPATELAIKLHTVLRLAGNTAETDKFSATWLKDHPKDIAFQLVLGDYALSRKDYASAAQQYKSILEIQPNNALVLNNLAWATYKQKGAKAIEYAEKANGLAPDQPTIMDTLAVLLTDKGETARALKIQQKAVELAPQAPELRLNLARILIKAGNKAGAKNELETLAKLGAKFPEQAEVSQLLKDL